MLKKGEMSMISDRDPTNMEESALIHTIEFGYPERGYFECSRSLCT